MFTQPLPAERDIYETYEPEKEGAMTSDLNKKHDRCRTEKIVHLDPGLGLIIGSILDLELDARLRDK